MNFSELKLTRRILATIGVFGFVLKLAGCSSVPSSAEDQAIVARAERGVKHLDRSP